MNVEVKEAKYIIDNGDRTYTHSEMAEANEHDVDLMSMLCTLNKGEYLRIEGGAQPEIKITRVM